MSRHAAVRGLVAVWYLCLGAGWAADQGPATVRPETRDRAERGVIVSDAVFDDWALGGAAGAKRFRDHLETMLRKRIGQVEQMFLLTPAQRQKLTLAGHGDIKRLLETVEDARRDFDLASGDVTRLSEIRKNLRVLDVAVSYGPFEIGSLFEKTLRKMFDEKKLKKRSSGERKRSERK
jgi:hypothetical protein